VKLLRSTSLVLLAVAIILGMAFLYPNLPAKYHTHSFDVAYAFAGSLAVVWTLVLAANVHCR
jgi:hypothetical protein